MNKEKRSTLTNDKAGERGFQCEWPSMNEEKLLSVWCVVTDESDSEWNLGLGFHNLTLYSICVIYINAHNIKFTFLPSLIVSTRDPLSLTRTRHD